MGTFELAATVVAGTALVLAPIDPQPIRDLNAPMPDSTWVFDEAKVRRVREALGFTCWTPNTFLGETLTYITVWSQHELNCVYERVGGTVTTRPVERTTDGGKTTWPAIEITLTVPVDGVGDVRVVTDWDEPSGGQDLPVMRQIGDATLIDTPHTQSTVAETVAAQGGLAGYQRFYITPGAPLPSGRTIVHVDDPMGSAWRVIDDQGDVHWLHKQGQLKRYTGGTVAFIVPDSVYDLR